MTSIPFREDHSLDLTRRPGWPARASSTLSGEDANRPRGLHENLTLAGTTPPKPPTNGQRKKREDVCPEGWSLWAAGTEVVRKSMNRSSRFLVSPGPPSGYNP